MKRLLLHPSEIPLTDEINLLVEDYKTVVVTEMKDVLDELDADDFDALCFHGDIEAARLKALSDYLNSDDNFNHPILPIFSVGTLNDPILQEELAANAQFHFCKDESEFKETLDKIPSRWVLVIDPKKRNLVKVTGELSANGFEVEEASTIDMGMEKFIQNNYMAILIDVDAYDLTDVQKLADYVVANTLGKQKAAILTTSKKMNNKNLEKLVSQKIVYTSLHAPLQYGVLSSVLKELFYNYNVAIDSTNVVPDLDFKTIKAPKKLKAADTKELEGIDLRLVVNKQDKDGRTPLMKLCLAGDLLKARSLILSGATLSYTCKEKKTAFSYAIAGGNLIIIELLLNNGALEKCYSEESDPVIETLGLDNDKISKILFKYKPHLNKKFKGRPYLVYAILADKKEFFELLLKNGANPLLRGTDGLNALDWIRRNKLIDYLDLVQSHLKKKA